MSNSNLSSGENEPNTKSLHIFINTTLQRENNELSRVNEELLKRNEALYKTLMDLQGQAWQSKDKKKTKAHRDLQTENENIQKSIEMLQKQIVDLNQTITEIEANVSHSKSLNKKALTVNTVSIEKDNENLEIENKELLNEGKDLWKKMRALQDQYKEMAIKHKAEKETIKQINDNLQKDIVQMKTSMQEVKYSKYTKSIQKSLMDENMAIKQEVRELKDIVKGPDDA